MYSRCSAGDRYSGTPCGISSISRCTAGARLTVVTVLLVSGWRAHSTAVDDACQALRYKLFTSATKSAKTSCEVLYKNLLTTAPTGSFLCGTAAPPSPRPVHAEVNPSGDIRDLTASGAIDEEEM